jgi:hypothetical protein
MPSPGELVLAANLGDVTSPAKTGDFGMTGCPANLGDFGITDNASR